MNDPDAGNAGPDKWAAAVKKRDELQELLRGVNALVQDGSIKLSSVEEVKSLVAAAQEEVDQLKRGRYQMQKWHEGHQPDNSEPERMPATQQLSPRPERGADRPTTAGVAASRRPHQRQLPR